MTSPDGHGHNAKQSHYGRLVMMSAVSFITMYFLMYAMVNSSSNVLMNVNQVYMAGLMAAPMVVIELVLMAGMYHNKRLNAAIGAAAVAATVAFWFLIRQQTAIGDRQFLRSMIPHHAAAILMCNEAPIQDADIKALCRSIVSSQQGEIDEMKAMLQAKR